MVSKILKYKLQANLDLAEEEVENYTCVLLRISRKAPESAIAYHYQNEREKRIYSGSRKYSNACRRIFFSSIYHVHYGKFFEISLAL